MPNNQVPHPASDYAAQGKLSIFVKIIFILVTYLRGSISLAFTAK